MPVATPHTNQLSQRALLLSVGALALSVVAMTTMFIFVYSHGSGALESAAHASGRPPHAAEPPSPKPPLPARTDSAPATNRQPVSPPAAARPSGSDPAASRLADATRACPKRPDPLYRASVVELSADGESGIFVQRQALQAANPGDCD
jgi:hypothetical protein